VTDTYTYDAVGNRLTKNGATYSYDNADQMTQAAGVSYGYDANGNQTARASDTFAWDHENRLKQAVISGATSTYAYNGDGLRVSRTVGGQTANYVWDVASGLPVILQDGTNTYVWGLGLISITDGSGNQTYLLRDGLGSTTELADGAGNLTGTYRYDVFGAPRSQTGATTEFSFTGEQTDPTALQYLRARYYDPALGRFVSRDPQPATAAVPVTLNRYAYANNNPVNLVDKTGRSPYCTVETASGMAFHGFSLGVGDVIDTAWLCAGGIANSWVLRTLGITVFVSGYMYITLNAEEALNLVLDAIGDEEPAVSGRSLEDVLNADDRTFHKFLESLQNQAAKAGGATRTAEETRRILDEALDRGWTVEPSSEHEWVGGAHLDLYGPSGQSVHFPIPLGFTP
jgi:RHS repeat-associated protein